ncbi:hypothetical protein BCR34DRAFT_605742 [Clohesyomyces aquaticus]|uniref:Uncharacterized protein n=1 Tax=Clohesyomyces aquaticus TaxID=1231657 RepID=A0A1Y1YWB6_9PLEO|nr:hypothetical protein BCR34DRAFT_605742 [Clohesyomyces aquaticus]
MAFVPMPPKWSYREALGHVNGTTHMAWHFGMPLNMTVGPPMATWNNWDHFMPVMDHNSILLYRYSVVLLVVGFATPIAITFLSKLPFVSTLFEKLTPYLVCPSSIASYHNCSLPWQLGNPRMMGQVLYIIGFIILNIILSSVGYRLQWPMTHP